MGAPQLIDQNVVTGTPVGTLGGTPNTIPRWTGATTLGDSLLSQSGTTIVGSTMTGFGIGTTVSPWGAGRYALQVGGSPTSNIVGGSPNTVFGSNQYHDGTDARYINNGFAATYVQSAGEHRWSTAASGTAGAVATLTQYMVINSSGNVGIGTTSPAYKLHIEGTSTNGVLEVARLSNANAGSSATAELGFRTGATDTQRAYVSAGYGPSDYNLSLGTTIAGVKTETMRLTQGNVGIGTASPNDRVEVNGNARFTRPNVASQYLQYYGDASFNALMSVSSGKTFALFADANSAGILLQTQAAQPIVLSTNYIERMRISASGTQAQSQVAIGTSSFTSGCSLTVAQSIDASQSAQGLKLPATPGNTDPQTLDAYRENTFTTTTSSATNCSSITLSNLRYTQIGRLVTIEGTASFTVTAATTATSFYFTLPSGCNRGSTANAGAGLAVDNASGYSGALWNLAGTNNDVFLFFDASNPFGAGTSRTVPFSYSYYTAT